MLAFALCACSGDTSLGTDDVISAESSCSSDTVAKTSSSKKDSDARVSSGIQTEPDFSSTSSVKSSKSESTFSKSSSSTKAEEKASSATHESSSSLVNAGSSEDSGNSSSAEISSETSLEMSSGISLGIQTASSSEDRTSTSSLVYTKTFVLESDSCSFVAEKLSETAAFYKENGETLLKVKNMSGPCIKSAFYDESRVDDTLLIYLGPDINLTNCFCVSTHVFKVDEKNANVKFVKYVSNESPYYLDYSLYRNAVIEIATSEPFHGESDVLVKTNEYGFAMGSCSDDDPYDSGLKLQKKAKPAFDALSDEESELRKGYILNDGNGKYQVWLPDASDYCDVMAKVLMKRDGDTLYISYDFSNGGDASKCRCYKDHWFDIDSSYSDVKYIKFEGLAFEVAEK